MMTRSILKSMSYFIVSVCSLADSQVSNPGDGDPKPKKLSLETSNDNEQSYNDTEERRKSPKSARN